MRKIAISLSKGGVGKTTTAVNLAVALAKNQAKVLLIDTDTQGQVSAMLGIEPELGLAEVILGETKAQDALVEARKNCWLLSGGRALAGVKRFIARQEIGGERMLQECLSEIENNFDYILLDTSPGWDVLTVNALFYAQEIIVPASLEPLTLQGLIEFNKSVASIQKYNKELQVTYLLPTFLDGRVKKSTEILNQLNKHYSQLICKPIRYNTRLAESPAYKQTIFEYAPTSYGAEDYLCFAERILSDGRS
ncbi:MAG: putative Cobyrinic acid ac-diamide synthase [bacterium]|nr:MAG: putative Cobyrinic acid ac-diamide synthase [bacterium]